jgi:hypothetical protein
MTANKFMPSNSTVAGFVTLVVSAWFVAAAVIVAAPSFAATPLAAAKAKVAPVQEAAAVVPDVRFVIVVEAQRLPRATTL